MQNAKMSLAVMRFILIHLFGRPGDITVDKEDTGQFTSTLFFYSHSQ